MSDRQITRPALRLVDVARHPNRTDVLFLADRAQQHTSDTQHPIRVLVAEEQALVRAGYRALLERDGGITVSGEAASAEEAIAVATEIRPQLLLLDLELPGLEDLDAIASRVSHPALGQVAVMVIASSECDTRVLAALIAGAAGVLGRDVEPAELIRGVYALARGHAMVSAEAVRRLLSDLPSRSALRWPFLARLAKLTDRERVVVALVAQGLTNAEIAQKLVITAATAKTHVSRAMGKLGVRQRTQLVALAYESGLVQPPVGAGLTRATTQFQRTEFITRLDPPRKGAPLTAAGLRPRPR